MARIEGSARKAAGTEIGLVEEGRQAARLGPRRERPAGNDKEDGWEETPMSICLLEPLGCDRA